MNLRLIAGIDMGKFFSGTAILSPSNKVVARMKIHHDSNTGIKKAVNSLKKMEENFTSRSFVVMESTGHYHKIFFHSLCKAGFGVCSGNPIQTDSIRNTGIRKVKNNKTNAHKITPLCSFRDLKSTNISNEDIKCLRSLCRQYYKLNDELTVYKNRLTGIVDQVLLNFKDVFPSALSRTAIAVLEKRPTPEHILKASKCDLASLIRENSHKSLEWSTTKYGPLVSKAKEFVPLSINNPPNVIMMDVYIFIIKALYENLTKTLKTICQLIAEDMAKDTLTLLVTLELLQSIPGIGILTAATILAEVGGFSAFSKPGELVSYFSVDPSVMQSGEFTGTRNKMSKRGSRLLRRVIFTIALANIRTKHDKRPYNSVLIEFYKHKRQNKSKKVALGAVIHKLICIIFAVLRDRKPFELRVAPRSVPRCLQQSI